MKKIIHTNEAPKAIGPYSQATEMNGMLFISGQVPLDANTGKIYYSPSQDNLAHCGKQRSMQSPL